MGRQVAEDMDTVSWANNKGSEATTTIKVTLTGNLQEPKNKHLQTIIKEWKNPSDTDKEESKRLGEEKETEEESEQGDRTRGDNNTKVQFGLARIIEFIPMENDQEVSIDWSIFPELFTSPTQAKIYECRAKHQNIGC